MEKIAGTRRKLRKVALKEFCSLLRHRNHALFPILNSKVAERRVRPDEVAHAQEPLLEIDPTWQRMVDLPPPKPEVKTQNQEELEVIVLGSSRRAGRVARKSRTGDPKPVRAFRSPHRQRDCAESFSRCAPTETGLQCTQSRSRRSDQTRGRAGRRTIPEDLGW